ncbi:MAG: DUF1934 domain-containing protein [Tissierellia bacterium]|nr:DUF1934 domain-containing protein [Tissierellia bacterium]
MENVKVRINTSQTIDQAGNEDVIELLTEASLEKLDECFVINYDDSTMTEQEGSRTRLKIYKNKMLMTKVGVYSTKMEFEEGVSYNNLYTTPYGNFDLEFITILYDNKLNEEGKGSVYIEYKIIFASLEEIYTKLNIDIF